MPFFTNKMTGLSPVIVHSPGVYDPILNDLAEHCLPWVYDWKVPGDLTLCTINVPAPGWYDNHPGKKTGLFESVCEKANLDVLVAKECSNYHPNLKLDGFMWLVKNCKTKYMLFSDSSDSLLVDSPHIALERFIETKLKMLWHGESWPGWPNTPDLIVPAAINRYSGSYPCLNSGGFIAETSFAKVFMEECLTKTNLGGIVNDQPVTRLTADQWKPYVDIDKEATIFQPMSISSWNSIVAMDRSAWPHHSQVEELVKSFGEQEVWMAEIGVLNARLSSHLLRTCPLLNLFMVDSWKPYEGDPCYSGYTKDQFSYFRDQSIRLTNFAHGRRFVLEQTSSETASKTPDECLDIVFIDGDHTYEHVAQDILTWRRKVRKGGIVAGHDFCDGFPGVKRAVTELVKDIPELELKLGAGDVWFYVKP